MNKRYHSIPGAGVLRPRKASKDSIKTLQHKNLHKKLETNGEAYFKSRYSQYNNIKPHKDEDNLNVSISNDPEIQNKLKYSTNLYSDYQEYFKTYRPHINHLCPIKSMRTPEFVHSPLPSTLPKENYASYKASSLKLLKSTNFRIKRAKEYIKIAKNIILRF
jgi:hypothetical protein